MGNPIIGVPISDSATLTGSGAAAGAPYTNLQRMMPGKVYSTSGGAPYYIEMDLASAMEWNAAFLGFHTASSTALWRVRAATSQANLTASPGFDSGQALSLDGATQHASQASLTTPTEFTLEMLVRPRSFTTLGAIARLNAATSGTFDISLNNGLVSIGGAGVTTLNATTLTIFEQVHVAVVVTASTAQIFLDGELAATGPSALSFTGTITATFGKAGSLSVWGNLDISEVRYWTTARTQAQIAANMRGPLTTPITGLVGYWQFNGAATNTGSAGGSATLTGSPSYVNRERMWASGDLGEFSRRHSLLWLGDGGRAAESVTYRWARFDFSESITAGRLALYNAFEFPVTADRVGVPVVGYTDPSSKTPLPGGQTSVNRFGVRPRHGPFTMRLTSQDDVDALDAIYRTRGTSRDVLWCRDPDETPGRFRRIGYGTLAGDLSINLVAFQAWDTTFGIDGLE